MAVNNKQDEDYLDSLLRSVLGGSEGQNNTQLNNDSESDVVSDELLGDIEKDLFAEGIDNADVSLSFDSEQPGAADDLENHVPAKKEKKNRKGFFGRKEKKQSEAATQEEFADIENLFADEFVAQQEENPENTGTEQNVTPPEGFEGIFADETVADESITSASDDEMSGLYDIFGGSETLEDTEIDRLEEEKPSKKKKKKKSGKSGLFGRKKAKEEEQEETEAITDDIFGLPEEPQPGEDMDFGGLGDLFMGGSEESSIESDDENAKLIEEMENGEYDEEDILESEKEKPKKKEKKKKQKKPKKEKQPKPKKVKPKKEKKPKKPKEPDVIIPISKHFAVFSVSFIILIIVCVVLGGKYYNYITKTDAAVAYYVNKDYEAAYEELLGLEMHEDDRYFYEQVETIMFVNRHYTSYKSLYKLEKYDKALHTLLRGVYMYDKYKEQARELNCFDDITTVLGWIDKALLEDFGLTESQARELNLIENRYEYAAKVYEISDVVKEKEEAKKEAELKENEEKESNDGQAAE